MNSIVQAVTNIPLALSNLKSPFKMKTLYILLLSLLTALSLQSQCNQDRHSTTATDGWISCEKATNPDNSIGASHWIRYDFGQVYSLHQVSIWNTSHPAFVKDGVKDVVFSFSNNGINWTTIDTFTIPRGEVSSFYEGSMICDLKGTSAQYILITALNNHGGDCYGFSEIRFYTENAPNTEFTLDLRPCENSGIYKNISALLDLNGMYSGSGVTDNGDGTFDFDPHKTGPGKYKILYSYEEGGENFELSTFINVLPCGMEICPDCTNCDNIDASIFNQPSIPSDTYHTGVISGNGNVINGSNVNFRASKSIELEPGFEIEPLSNFVAEIRTCYDNLISNHDFEEGLSSWQWNSNNGNSDVQATEVYEGDNSIKIEINSASGSVYDAELKQTGITLESNKTYRISMAVKAVDIEFFEIRLQKNDNPYTQYFKKDLYPQNYWNTYSFEVTIEENVPDAFLTFYCGKDVGVLYFDQIKMVEIY